MNLKKELEDVKESIMKDFIKDNNDANVDKSIRELSKNAFMSYLNNDKIIFEEYMDLIDELVNVFSETFPNIRDYVNYCFLDNMNVTLNTLFKKDFNLKTFHNTKLKQKEIGTTKNINYEKLHERDRKLMLEIIDYENNVKSLKKKNEDLKLKLKIISKEKGDYYE